MELSKLVKIVIFVPESHADHMREAIGQAGAGKIGNYTHCSFSTKVQGRFSPEEGAHPTIGEVGKFEAVEEERIETICERKKLPEVLAAIRKAHPYEETATDVYPLEDVIL